jgi:hypothetical protein
MSQNPSLLLELGPNPPVTTRKHRLKYGRQVARGRLITSEAGLCRQMRCEHLWEVATDVFELHGTFWPPAFVAMDADGTESGPDAAEGIMLHLGSWATFLAFPFYLEEFLEAVDEQDADATRFEFELATEGLWVVETRDGDAHLGVLRRTPGRIEVRSGLPGRPAVLLSGEVERVTRAGDHPDIEVLNEYDEPIPWREAFSFSARRAAL